MGIERSASDYQQKVQEAKEAKPPEFIVDDPQGYQGLIFNVAPDGQLSVHSKRSPADSGIIKFVPPEKAQELEEWLKTYFKKS